MCLRQGHLGEGHAAVRSWKIRRGDTKLFTFGCLGRILLWLYSVCKHDYGDKWCPSGVCTGTSAV